MENKIRVDVTISHFVYGLGKQYTSDITGLEVDAKALRDDTLLKAAVNDYCADWARHIKPYDAASEDYILEFWHDDKKIWVALLSNYAYLFGRALSDIELDY